MKLERNSGILLHPTSLPDSPVCGSFGKPAREWLNELAAFGIGVWQFLPLAPTDSFGSPYSSPSSFAFNPWFLDQNDLVRDGFLTNNLEDFSSANDCFKNRVDFHLANSKVKSLRFSLVDDWYKQNRTIQEEFEIWCSKQFWLDDHSIFMELKIQNNDLPWWEWPEEYAGRDKKELENWKKNNQKELLGHKLLQWHLDRQWQSIRELAKNLGIYLFGDVPFYVSKDSADVWGNRSLFSILTYGAPSLAMSTSSATAPKMARYCCPLVPTFSAAPAIRSRKALASCQASLMTSNLPGQHALRSLPPLPTWSWHQSSESMLSKP